MIKPELDPEFDVATILQRFCIPPACKFVTIWAGPLSSKRWVCDWPRSDAPEWEEKFRIQVAGRVQDLIFAVKVRLPPPFCSPGPFHALHFISPKPGFREGDASLYFVCL